MSCKSCWKNRVTGMLIEIISTHMMPFSLMAIIRLSDRKTRHRRWRIDDARLHARHDERHDDKCAAEAIQE